MRGKWGVPVPTVPNELFSSWLVRAALIQGCNPLVLTGEVWGKYRILTIDADRIYEDELLHSIAVLSGNSIESFKQNSLRPITERIVGGRPFEKAIWPWILALGTRNTKRNGGLQYCPTCLAEDVKPYFRKQWRLAWHTVCEKHQMMLLDRCPVCNSPIEPHRLQAVDRAIKFCATCKSDLSSAPVQSTSVEALNFQLITDQVISNNYGHFQEQQINISQWFMLIDFLVSMLRRANRSQTTVLLDFISQLAKPIPLNFPVLSGAGVELLQTKDRQVLFTHLYPLLLISKEEFEQVAINANVTRQAFCSKDEVLPEAFKVLYDTLPDNPRLRSDKARRVRSHPRPKHEVIRMMKSLERKLEMAQR